MRLLGTTMNGIGLVLAEIDSASLSQLLDDPLKGFLLGRIPELNGFRVSVSQPFI